MINKAVKALSKLVGDDDSRPVLTKVQIAPGKAVATDSYILGELTYPKTGSCNKKIKTKEEFEPFLITPEELNSVLPEEKEQDKCGYCEYGDFDMPAPIPSAAFVTSQRNMKTRRETKIASNNTSVNVVINNESIEKYPVVETLLVSDEPKEHRVTFDPELMARLFESIAESGFRHVELSFSPGDSNSQSQKPLIIKADNRCGLKGRFAIMPVRTE